MPIEDGTAKVTEVLATINPFTERSRPMTSANVSAIERWLEKLVAIESKRCFAGTGASAEDLQEILVLRLQELVRRRREKKEAVAFSGWSGWCEADTADFEIELERIHQ